MSSRTRSLLLAGVTILLLSCLAIGPVTGQQVPNVTVDIDQDSMTADVSVGKGVLLRYSGNVTISGEFPSGVQLEATVVDEDWTVTIDPSTPVLVPGDGVVSFDGTVAVPLYAIERPYELRVNATVDYGMPDPMRKSDTMDIIVIKNRVVVEVQVPSTIDMDQSNVTQMFVFTFKVVNRGATDDTFSFSVGDITEIKDKGWFVDLMLEDEMVASGSFVYVNMNVTIPANALPGTYEFGFMAESDATDSYDEGKAFVTVNTIPVIKKPKEDVFSFLGMNYDQLFILTIAIIGVCMIVVFLGGTEIGFFALLIYILVPLYCRIKKEKVLDNFTRGQIYGYIKANPGAHYMEVQNQLEITNGVLAHHLKVLEREEFIQVHRDGLYKRFYPSHVKVSKKGKHLSRLQKDLLEEVERHPGINQKMLSKYLGESKQVISYHIKVLSKAKLIKVAKEGSRSKVYSTKSHRSRTRPEEDVEPVPEKDPILEAEIVTASSEGAGPPPIGRL